MFCPKCGNQADDADAFCRRCGSGLQAAVPARSLARKPKSSSGLKIATVVILFLFAAGAIRALLPSSEAAPTRTSLSFSAAAEPASQPELRLCTEIAGYVNKLATFAPTQCFARHFAAGQPADLVIYTPQTLGLQLKTPAPEPFADAEKGWVMVAVAASGHAMNQHPATPISYIILADHGATEDHSAFRIQARAARDLQREMKMNKLSLRDAYAKVLSSMQPFQLSDSLWEIH